MEQLQLVAFSGAEGNSIVTAPQWQVPVGMEMASLVFDWRRAGLRDCDA